MIEKLQKEKQVIDNFLLSFLSEEKKKFEKQSLVKDAFSKIRGFVISGKTVRGGLFLLAVKALDEKKYQTEQKDLLKIAAALELIHSSLLIHDDIIDQDEKRRGQNSIWHQYQLDVENKNYQNPKEYGQNQAICLANIANFLAISLLEKTSVLPTIYQEIIKTNFAEMLDSKITSQKELPGFGEVLEMYLFKTARYTFSLPLKLAGLINELEDEQITQLEKIGEKLGLIFQIVDDSISIFTPEELSGKSFASDIREGKKTLFYLTLLEEVPSSEKNFLITKYGQKNLTKEEIAKIQNLFRQSAQTKIEKLLNQFKKKTQVEIAEIEPKEMNLLLKEILEYNFSRKF
ncbi:polyprenyl synthetase family protein [Patescibacteria group bacterium]|nr:polyprenyl synthetase family protein [Patescibacteria group bacterium]